MLVLTHARRLVLALALTALLGTAAVPSAALADREFPDFYGTIIRVDRDRGMVTLMTDSDETITVDVRDLGARPFEEGAFELDNVVLIRARRVENGFVAMSWEEARSGREQFRD